MCLAAIYWSRMDEIFYGNTAADAAAAGFDDAFLYEEIKKPVGGRTIPAERMLSDEAQENFAAWRRFAARVHY
jgi:tRNA(Arg) A34 adenosine deaminase TadA